jgi:SAM-dependent methyltransferase
LSGAAGQSAAIAMNVGARLPRAPTPCDLPPEFDPHFYRSGNADLAAFPDAELAEHFERWGATEGRRGSPLAERAGLLAAVAARESGRILEVGPGCAPVVSGSKVRYLDIARAEQLRARASVDEHAASMVPYIHYVATVDAMPRSFDAAIACRSIGHHPDLIGHLQSIGRVLVEGGLYYLVIPDRRYTSAVNLALTSVAGVIAAHVERRSVHTWESVIADRALRIDDDVPARWAGNKAPQPSEERAKRIAAAIDEHQQASGYIDVEAWHFTPASFQDLSALLFDLGLSPLAPVRVWATPFHRDEFCAVLERS